MEGGLRTDGVFAKSLVFLPPRPLLYISFMPPLRSGEGLAASGGSCEREMGCWCVHCHCRSSLLGRIGGID